MRQGVALAYRLRISWPPVRRFPDHLTDHYVTAYG